MLTGIVEIVPGVSLLKGRLSSHETTQMLQAEGLAESDLIPGKYEGILLLKAGAEVHFQDYNQEVLRALTAPNVAANTAASGQHAEGCTLRRPRYFAGDWTGLPCLLEKEGLLATYDVILSAETVYNLDSQRHLLKCIKQGLRPKVGQAWIAAKSYYFGVGGGTASFIQLVDRDGTFEVKAVDVIDDGASNKREILLLSFKA
ncbi:hypothetical protein WJX75_003758 [Coccomyxa subellipsoidea]|uniref:S-adenosyl-L-methionine-dependent methyltransferase n=1 Tax=Coccomyxa subellipsoidea TaxID=248742 RepID=A0ABR2Z346_9CHLO